MTKPLLNNATYACEKSFHIRVTQGQVNWSQPLGLALGPLNREDEPLENQSNLSL